MQCWNWNRWAKNGRKEFLRWCSPLMDLSPAPQKSGRSHFLGKSELVQISAINANAASKPFWFFIWAPEVQYALRQVIEKEKRSWGFFLLSPVGVWLTISDKPTELERWSYTSVKSCSIAIWPCWFPSLCLLPVEAGPVCWRCFCVSRAAEGDTP